MGKNILVGKELGTILWRILLDGFRPFFFIVGGLISQPHIYPCSPIWHTLKRESVGISGSPMALSGLS